MAEISIDKEIEDLKLKIEEARRDISESEIILRYLESKNGNKVKLPIGAVKNNASIDLDIDELISATVSKEPKTIITDVMDAIAHFGEREFSVPMIVTVMFRLGTVENTDDKLIRAKISGVLAQQTKKGILMMTFKGGGNVPHKYKMRSESDKTIDEDNSNAYKHLENHSKEVKFDDTNDDLIGES